MASAEARLRESITLVSTDNTDAQIVLL